MSETIYREDLKNETAIGWYESGLKAYETQYFMDEEVAVQEWTEAGEVVPAPLVPLGLVRTWKVWRDRAVLQRPRSKLCIYRIWAAQ